MFPFFDSNNLFVIDFFDIILFLFLQWHWCFFLQLILDFMSVKEGDWNMY